MWRPAGQHLVEDHAERVDIGAVIQFVATQLFRRHVLWRANGKACSGEGQSVGLPLRLPGARCQNRERGFAVGVQQDIAWLHVTMDEAVRMRHRKRRANLVTMAHRLVER